MRFVNALFCSISATDRDSALDRVRLLLALSINAIVIATVNSYNVILFLVRFIVR